VTTGALRGELLPRTRGEIRSRSRDWIVATDGGRVVGCLAVELVEPTLAEIRSIAVSDGYRGRGLGQRLLEVAIQRGRQEQVQHLFAVTAAVELFERSGFEPLPEDAPPERFNGRPIRERYQVVMAELFKLTTEAPDAPFTPAPTLAPPQLAAPERPERGRQDGLLALAD
jgi:N-acetylglutamate synthase-like GNAT family acetyltransferase